VCMAAGWPVSATTRALILSPADVGGLLAGPKLARRCWSFVIFYRRGIALLDSGAMITLRHAKDDRTAWKASAHRGALHVGAERASGQPSAWSSRWLSDSWLSERGAKKRLPQG
jgi:hypothetical protein